MEVNLAKLSRYKQVLGIAVAGVILAVIFVPLQSAQAYTAELTLPNASTSAVPTSAVGSTFRVTITPSIGELISVETIELILDNDTADVKRAVFGSNGHRTEGLPTLTRGNLDITIPTPTAQGYGYGYGLVSSGTTFSSPYSYAFTYSNAFIAGNTVGYSNAVSGANLVTGIIGDGTAQIVIEGKLNTALMDAGSHTLDVLVNTGAGGNGVDKIVTPQLSFTTVGNSSVGSSTVTAGTDKTVQDFIPDVPPGKLKIKFANTGGGSVAAQKGKPADIQSLLGQSIFSSTTSNTGTFSFGSTTATTAGDVFEIDTSGIISYSGIIEVTIPYDESLLPSGISEGDLKLFHWTGTAWEDVTFSVDTVNNTITGHLTSLSPVVAGYTSTTTTTTPAGLNRPGGGGITVDLTPFYAEEYFRNHPLEKVKFRTSDILGADGNLVTSIKSGEQVTIATTFKSYREAEQTYALIILIQNSEGFTTDLGWLSGTVPGAGMGEGSRSWTPSESGEYTIRIFVWDGVSGSPVPLSEVTQKSIRVS